MAYLLDANVFIAAKNLHYGLDFCPAFWDWIVREHQAGNVFSIDKVDDELSAGQDDLALWAAGLPDAFFSKPDATTLPALGTIANWVNGQPNYSAAAKSTFLQIADYYLVAQALAGGHVVVTHERPNQLSTRGEDSERLPWHRRDMCNAVRDVAARAGAIRLGGALMKECSGQHKQPAKAAKLDAAIAANLKDIGYGG